MKGLEIPEQKIDESRECPLGTNERFRANQEHQKRMMGEVAN